MLHRTTNVSVTPPSPVGHLVGADVDLRWLMPPLQEETPRGMWMSAGASGPVETVPVGMIEVSDDPGTLWLLQPPPESGPSGMWMSAGASGPVTAPPPQALALGVSTTGTYSNFATWLGRDTAFQLVWSLTDTWTNLGNSAFSTWTPWLDADPTRYMNIGVGMCVSGTTLQQVAGGLAAAETAFRNLATNIINVYRNRPHILRLGWEMDGDWYHWKCRSGTTPLTANYNYFAAAFRNIVTWMDSQQPTNQFKYAICPTDEMGRTVFGSPRATGQTTFLNTIWPGDSYVDLVMCDSYDMWGSGYPIPSGASEATITSRRDQHWATQEADMNNLSQFAQAHGNKPMGLGEWGVVVTNTGIGGSTNPLFGMLAHNVTHHSFYDENLTEQYHKISPPDNATRYPLASVKFKDLFG
jgi:hypothetical protein